MSSPENPFVVVDKHTIEKPFGWVFFFNTKKFLETGQFHDGLAGNGPIIVNRDTGSIEFFGTAVPPSHSIAKYEQRLAAEQNSPDLAQMAEHLCGLKLDPSATLHHELMSDALFWSDEVPKGRPAKEVWALRPVLRYRTGLILGLNLTEFQKDWETAKALFPKWIGFRKERCSRSVELEYEYKRFSRKKNALVKRIFP